MYVLKYFTHNFSWEWNGQYGHSTIDKSLVNFFFCRRIASDFENIVKLFSIASLDIFCGPSYLLIYIIMLIIEKC